MLSLTAAPKGSLGAQKLARAGFTEVQPRQTDPIFAETRFLYLRHPHGKEPLTVKVRQTLDPQTLDFKP